MESHNILYSFYFSHNNHVYEFWLKSEKGWGFPLGDLTRNIPGTRQPFLWKRCLNQRVRSDPLGSTSNQEIVYEFIKSVFSQHTPTTENNSFDFPAQHQHHHTHQPQVTKPVIRYDHSAHRKLRQHHIRQHQVNCHNHSVPHVNVCSASKAHGTSHLTAPCL